MQYKQTNVPSLHAPTPDGVVLIESACLVVVYCLNLFVLNGWYNAKVVYVNQGIF